VSRYGRRQVHQPLTSRSLETGIPPAVPTPNYTGTVILAAGKGADRVRRLPRPKVVFPGPIIGSAPALVSIPRYLGTFVRAGRGARPDIRKRVCLTKLRLTPVGGFPGAKLGYLTANPTREVRNFTIQLSRQGTLTTQ
jgi:hypothetical protein